MEFRAFGITGVYAVQDDINTVSALKCSKDFHVFGLNRCYKMVVGCLEWCSIKVYKGLN